MQNRQDCSGQELVNMQGSRGKWKTHPQALFFFVFSLTWWLFHCIHMIHLSRQAQGGKGEEEKERECKGHHGAKVQQHKKVK